MSELGDSEGGSHICAVMVCAECQPIPTDEVAGQLQIPGDPAGKW